MSERGEKSKCESLKLVTTSWSFTQMKGEKTKEENKPRRKKI